MKLRFFCAFVSLSMMGVACQVQKIARQTNVAPPQIDTAQYHIGFFVYDPAAQKVIAEQNAAKSFVAASNMKYFTLYAACRLLKDSLQAFAYDERADSLIVWGLGDPSFLNPKMYHNDRAYLFLNQAPKEVYLNFYCPIPIAPLGTGWSWDDYLGEYAAPRSDFPIYGNVVTFSWVKGVWRIMPKYFEKTQQTAAAGQYLYTHKVWRPFENNGFVEPSPPESKSIFKQAIPFYPDRATTLALLRDTLHREITPVWKPLPRGVRRLMSVPLDSAYCVMLQESDNHIAEQLLLQCAAAVSDTMQTEVAIRYVKRNFLQDFSYNYEWVDGSGLSRYNLCGPQAMVNLLMKIETAVTRSKLQSWLAVGGKKGTIKDILKAEKPYVFAKSGSMRGVYNLAGYLRTKSGKTFIFSYMNNGFTTPQTVVKRQVENILKKMSDEN